MVYSAEEESWSIETEPTALGWRARATSGWGRKYGISSTLEGDRIWTWRPTERWAVRRVTRGLRRWLRREAREGARAERGGVYPVNL